MSSDAVTGRAATAPFRFGLQLGPRADEIDALGRQAEDGGFDVVSVADHVGPGGLAPLPALARLAAGTTTIGLGTLVLNNDMRNPVQLAWEAATIHAISGGRLELGLGAGHTPQEYAATGIPIDHPVVRKGRLAESIEIIGRLFAGEDVNVEGEHYSISGAQIEMSGMAAPPVLVGGNGEALLRHAAQHADLIGLQGLGRTLPDGHRHTVRWDPEHLDAQVATIKEASGDRDVELNALIQVVAITGDRQAELDRICERADGLDPAHAAATPFLAIGTVAEIAAQLVAARERWGITYFTVRSPEFAPVIEELRAIG